MLPENRNGKGIEVKALNRRDLMKRTLQLGTAVYVAPMILAHETPVGAQVSAACVGATCDNLFNCQGSESCFCFALADGSGFCGTSVFCEGLAACSLVAPCSAGFVCQVDTCCDSPGICVAATTACNLALPTLTPLGPGRSSTSR
jgi:hypothetical protein